MHGRLEAIVASEQAAGNPPAERVNMALLEICCCSMECALTAQQKAARIGARTVCRAPAKEGELHAPSAHGRLTQRARAYYDYYIRLFRHSRGGDFYATLTANLPPCWKIFTRQRSCPDFFPGWILLAC